MSQIENIANLFKELAETFGGREKADYRGREKADYRGREKADYRGREKADYIFRNNTRSKEAFVDGGAYFGAISPDEEEKGPYHDLSIVCFPSQDGCSGIVCLAVGARDSRMTLT